MFILQTWVTWASKVTFKNLQLCSIKTKGKYAPCDVTRSRTDVRIAYSEVTKYAFRNCASNVA